MLKRLFAASALVLGLGVAGFAQKVEKPWALGITVGGAFGLGDFGSTKLTTDADKGTGFASYGYASNLSAAYYFHPNIALGVRVGYNTFFTNTSKYQDAVKSDYNRAGYSLANYEATGGVFTGINALVGPRGAVQLGGIELYLQPLVGFSTLIASPFTTTSREVQTGTPAQSTTTSNQTGKINAGLSYGASLGLRTSLSSTVGFFLDLNYLNLGTRKTETTFDAQNSSVYVLPGGALASTTSNFSGSGEGKMAISQASVNLGISINF